ncbi:methylated-DNA--[protein]-cysteine S-methyltransferase [uncultured Bacteroides sp.]|uniref:methylated-DNA--[protein]-cysteine S-methyltransferase n=1 Tax=uncultured Bacteroides sp. TaxID=162156 RepID=UPI002AAB81C0|nr:methylated-DNA--[protein]-cysteine S-methyltransferase [uncultured Bacteroides sp.]
MDTFYYSSPVGVLEIKSAENQITQLLFKDSAGVSSENLSDVMKECIHQLDEYFAGNLQNFSLPLAPEGTHFQESVWKALQTIPYGQTISYKQLAERVENPKACRAVGTANGRNPIAIIIPCHRVIAADGSLGGYAGGLDVKTTLLRLEGINRF